MKNRYMLTACYSLVAVSAINATYDYQKQEARSERNAHLASQASAQWREAKALKRQARAVERQAQATSAQNRLIAALAVCAGAVVVTHAINTERHPRIKIGAGVLAAGACLPAVNEIRKVLQ